MRQTNHQSLQPVTSTNTWVKSIAWCRNRRRSLHMRRTDHHSLEGTTKTNHLTDDHQNESIDRCWNRKKLLRIRRTKNNRFNQLLESISQPITQINQSSDSSFGRWVDDCTVIAIDQLIDTEIERNHLAWDRQFYHSDKSIEWLIIWSIDW